ncbi:hypothetical protein AB6H17_11170 [Proteus vulgaris]|uniref:hypothetical protein n=1 Tax=Proteus vulgaris TaxID=585 RepID=UPI0034DDB98E
MTKTVLVPVDFTELGLLDKVVSHLKALSVADKLNIHFLSVIPKVTSLLLDSHLQGKTDSQVINNVLKLHYLH